MDKNKKVEQTAQGAEPLPVEHYRKMIIEDLKTARVICHLVSKDQKVLAIVTDVLKERLSLSPELIRDSAEKAFTFLTYALETSVLLDSVADVTQGLAENFKQQQANASMGNSSDHTRR